MPKQPVHADSASTRVLDLPGTDQQMLRDLYGIHDENLRLMEQRLGIGISARGSQVTLKGAEPGVRLAQQILQQVVLLLQNGGTGKAQEVAQAIRLLLQEPDADLKALHAAPIQVPSRKRMIYARTPGQKQYIEAIRQHDMVFGIGPAGTGKTYLAMAMAVASLLARQHDRLVLCRPAVEAGEKLGFLPGSMQEKVNPYLRPLYDALHDMLEVEQINRYLEDGTIEVAPLAFMRGRTLAQSFVILDEGQNCTPEQMKMFLTRLGPGSKVVVTGDITQIDLPEAIASGLIEAVRILREVPQIHIQLLTDTDVVRHPLVQAIVNAYEVKGGSGI